MRRICDSDPSLQNPVVPPCLGASGRVLATQALAILRELQPFARGGCCHSPPLRTRDRPMSDNTINAALRRLGYSSEEAPGHGFRSMASTLLNEQGFPPDVIELQLAHTERNKVSRVAPSGRLQCTADRPRGGAVPARCDACHPPCWATRHCRG